VRTGTKTEQFLRVKQCIRIHPDWTDDQVAEAEGIKEFDRELITTARKDLEAG
jgi:hypothetical protein